MATLEKETQVKQRRRTISEFIISHRRTWEYLGNGVFAIYSCFFMFVMLSDFLARHRASSLLLILWDAVAVWFAVTRTMPKETNVSPYDWVISLFGLLPLLLRPAAEVHDHVLLLAAQLFGQAVALAGLFSLNKSMGVVAANRGVKTSGMYRVVRHPIYAGFFVFIGAYVLQNITAWNVLIYVALISGQHLRMEQEERVLCKDADYAVYARQTRWRILPFIY
jgi:protein-S-isoprenylcysteine O-methyltransferase Ste14